MRGNFGLNYKIARNCLTYMLDFIVMQMSKGNREKGYCVKSKRTLYGLVKWTGNVDLVMCVFSSPPQTLF